MMLEDILGIGKDVDIPSEIIKEKVKVGGLRLIKPKPVKTVKIPKRIIKIKIIPRLSLKKIRRNKRRW